MFLRLSGLPRFAFAGDDDMTHAELVQVVFDALLAVATVGGDGPRPPAGPADDPPDGGGELRGVGWVAPGQRVVEHDPVVVVEDLSLVAELDRLAEAAFRDGAGVAVVQADPPGRAVGDDPPDALAGLRGDPPGQVNSGQPRAAR